MLIPVIENVLKLNDEVAAINRSLLREARVFAVDLIGAPGCGKTKLLEETIRLLEGSRRVAVICGDLATQRDAERIGRLKVPVVQVNTGRGCHLEANHVREAMMRLDLAALDLLFVENVGNLICPVGFDLGQDVKIGMFSVTGGDDKAAKHPWIVCESSLLLLSQIDLLPHVQFDLPLFRDDVRQLNPRVEMLELSPTTGAGMQEWCGWLQSRVVRPEVRSGGRSLAL